MNSTLKHSSFGLLASLLLLGCAPQRDDATSRDGVSSERLAVLSADGGWEGADIQIMDMSGKVLELIETDIYAPVGLSGHPSGDFIVTTNSEVLRVTRSGDVSTFNQEALPSVVFRTNVTDSGDVTVTEEYDVTEWDEDGDLVMHSVVPSTYCWMDAAPAVGSGSGVALLDVFGPTIAFWDSATGSFDDLAVGIGSDGNILGTDTSGNYYVGSSWGPELYQVTSEGEITALSSTAGSDGFDLEDVWGVRAIEPAGAQSVFVLVDESMEGSSIRRLDVATGISTPIVNAEDGLWLDLTLL
ncbi:MAG: hypothetical protein VX498_11840 [Myxococcota bacterium]|nr:hypothetical protein [Myxococcota bacterium]